MVKRRASRKFVVKSYSGIKILCGDENFRFLMKIMNFCEISWAPNRALGGDFRSVLYVKIPGGVALRNVQNFGIIRFVIGEWLLVVLVEFGWWLGWFGHGSDVISSCTWLVEMAFLFGRLLRAILFCTGLQFAGIMAGNYSYFLVGFSACVPDFVLWKLISFCPAPV